jgi:hypothetical protein
MVGAKYLNGKNVRIFSPWLDRSVLIHRTVDKSRTVPEKTILSKMA